MIVCNSNWLIRLRFEFAELLKLYMLGVCKPERDCIYGEEVIVLAELKLSLGEH